MPRTSPSELTISVTTRPQPPLRFTRRRNAVSVMPAIGASANGGARSIEPIFIADSLSWSVVRGLVRPVDQSSISPHVGGVHFDAHGLADRVHGEHQPRVRPLADQTADDALQRTVDDFDQLIPRA